MDKVAGRKPGRGPFIAGAFMTSSILQLVGSHGGWRLIDNGKPSFWFLEREQAMEIARVIADSRAGLRFIPTKIEAENDDGQFELVAQFP
jgi:hypothetical protein